MKPKVTQEHIERLQRILSHGQWMKGKHIDRKGLSTRIVRAIAEETGLVISTQKGYKLTEFATVEELEAARNDLYSRVAHITARALKIDTILDRRVAPNPFSTL